jgi:hypothetical protein|nr:MAG TPA: HOLLIDAY JUNCTION RESOLVASE, ENZYME, HOMOLOGOUS RECOMBINATION, HOLLIDAY [Caudoviricetes sp.]
MTKRSTKFYRKNEAEIMKRIGFKPTRNSGATWIEKCDGQSDHCICELKSTDNSSFTVKQEYLHTLESYAIEAHKLPVFAFQFLNTDEVWLSIKESDIEAFKDLIKQFVLEELQEEREKEESKLSPLLEKKYKKNVDKALDKVYDKGEKRKGGLKSSTSCHILQNSSSSSNKDVITNNTNNVLLEVNKHKAKQSIEARKLFLKEKQKEQEYYETMQKERNKNRRRTITQNRKEY